LAQTLKNKDPLFGLFESIRTEASKYSFSWHSPGNLTSSQYFALDIILGLVKFKEHQKITEIEGHPEIVFEWKDDENLLKEWRQSQVDCFLKIGNRYWLIETKYAEDTPQPCKPSKKTTVCQTDEWMYQCPLESEYDTQYAKVIRNPKGPFLQTELKKLDKCCPFLKREAFQFMRLISLAFLKEQNHPNQVWNVLILFPEGNTFIKNEIKDFLTCIRRPHNFKYQTVESLLSTVLLSPITEKWIEYIRNRYLLGSMDLTKT
jgi:hypothetical protein